jgi:hypothetical protein
MDAQKTLKLDCFLMENDESIQPKTMTFFSSITKRH